VAALNEQSSVLSRYAEDRIAPEQIGKVSGIRRAVLDFVELRTTGDKPKYDEFLRGAPLRDFASV
jgi:hypothetical protein